MTCYVFKPSRVRNGIRQTSSVYSGRYRLAGETKATTVALGIKDKQAAEAHLRKLVKEKEQEAEGLLLPKALRDASQRPLRDHLNDFLAAKSSADRDARYLYELKNRVLKLLKECRWTYAKDITAESFIAWRVGRKGSAKTLNEYLTSMRTLLNWMEQKGRLTFNALKSVEAPVVREALVKPRRALTDEEMKRLLGVAEGRSIVYRMSALTGLRRGELAQLQRRDLRLDSERPHVVARASTTKNHKQTTIPLHRELVAALHEYLRSLPLAATTPLFRDLLPTMGQFRADLKAAGIAFIDESGRRADFHSLRHTFCTNLQRAGTHQRELMELMRHSDRRLSDRVYTDTNLLGINEAVQKLPGFAPNDALQDAHELDASRLSASLAVTHPPFTNEPGIRIDKGFRHDMAQKDATGHVPEDGARYRVRTCDPCRVKAVLYH
jgi:integrase